MSFYSSSQPLFIASGLILCTYGLFIVAKKVQRTTNFELSDINNADKNISSCPVGSPHPYSKEKQFSGCIYLDNNATTPVYPEVYEAMIPFLTTCFGNPSSSHVFSAPCRDAILNARLSIGLLINSTNSEHEIIFTSCGTESDNRAIDIALKNYKTFAKDLITPHVITSSIEHPAIMKYLKALEVEGKINLTIISVCEEGFVNISELKENLQNNTALVTMMHSNNEVGTIQPIRKISQIIKQFNNNNNIRILFHSDAAQSLGKVGIDVISLGVDMLTIVGHKFGAPKGIAALYVRQGIPTSPMLVGGGQEKGVRGGTENVAYIAGIGRACELAKKEEHILLIHFLTLKLRLLKTILKGLSSKSDKIRVNGPVRSNQLKELSSDLNMLKIMIKSNNTLKGSRQGLENVLEQLPNTLSISFQGLSSTDIIKQLSYKVACSAGSACHSVHTDEFHDNNSIISISSVLLAMNIPEDFAIGTLRLSFGRHSSIYEAELAGKEIVKVVSELWK